MCILWSLLFQGRLLCSLAMFRFLLLSRTVSKCCWPNSSILSAPSKLLTHRFGNVVSSFLVLVVAVVVAAVVVVVVFLTCTPWDGQPGRFVGSIWMMP